MRRRCGSSSVFRTTPDRRVVLIRLGSRGSRLALTQAAAAADALRAARPELEIALVPITTAGDRDRTRPFGEIGARGVFVKELEEALLARSVDVAVHSAKDMTSTAVAGLSVGAYLARDDPRDALCGAARLEPGMRIGTASVRRRALLLALEPTLSVEPLRGNVDTRLRKRGERGLDAVVLAAAGLDRLGLDGGDRPSLRSRRAAAGGRPGRRRAPGQGRARTELVSLSTIRTRAAGSRPNALVSPEWVAAASPLSPLTTTALCSRHSWRPRTARGWSGAAATIRSPSRTSWSPRRPPGPALTTRRRVVVTGARDGGARLAPARGEGSGPDPCPLIRTVVVPGPPFGPRATRGSSSRARGPSTPSLERVQGSAPGGRRRRSGYRRGASRARDRAALSIARDSTQEGLVRELGPRLEPGRSRALRGRGRRARPACARARRRRRGALPDGGDDGRVLPRPPISSCSPPHRPRRAFARLGIDLPCVSIGPVPPPQRALAGSASSPKRSVTTPTGSSRRLG